MARDAIARLEDVDKDSLKIDTAKGTLTFQAKKGKSLDPGRLLEAIKATTFHSRLNYLEISVTGEVVRGEKGPLLKVTGASQQFALGNEPNPVSKAEAGTPFQRLQKALDQGERIMRVVGRVQGWGADFSRRRNAPPGDGPAEAAKAAGADGKGVPLLVVTSFETAPKEK